MIQRSVLGVLNKKWVVISGAAGGRSLVRVCGPSVNGGGGGGNLGKYEVWC